MWGEVVSVDGFHVMAYDVPSATAFDHGEIPVPDLSSVGHTPRPSISPCTSRPTSRRDGARHTISSTPPIKAASIAYTG